MTAATGNDRAGMHILHVAEAQWHGGLFNPPCWQFVSRNRESSNAMGVRRASKIRLDARGLGGPENRFEEVAVAVDE